MRWVKNVAHIREIGNAYTIVARKSGGKGVFEDLGTGGRILKEILQEQSVTEWTEFSLVQGPVVSSYEY
jgi:hypothetical protein